MEIYRLCPRKSKVNQDIQRERGGGIEREREGEREGERKRERERERESVARHEVERVGAASMD